MKTIEILGEKAEYYLSHVCRTIDKSQLYLLSLIHISEPTRH